MSHIDATITATLVSEDERLAFTPKLFGKHFMLGEQLVYDWMGSLCTEYTGGFWAFYELSNGGMFMAPTEQLEMHLRWAMNYSSEHVSAQAAGIVATLFAMNQVINSEQYEQSLIDRFYALREYAAAHEDARAIYRLID